MLDRLIQTHTRKQHSGRRTKEIERAETDISPMNLIDFLKAPDLIFFEKLNYVDALRKSRTTSEAEGLKELLHCMSKAMEKHADIEGRFLFPGLKADLGREMDLVCIWEFEHGRIRQILKTLKETKNPSKVRAEAGRFVFKRP